MDTIASGSSAKSRGDFSQFPVCIWIDIYVGPAIIDVLGILGEDSILNRSIEVVGLVLRGRFFM